MNRHEFLGHLHHVVAPRNYLEIGVSDGRSLTLAQVPSIGIDPAPKVKQQLHRDVVGHPFREPEEVTRAGDPPALYLGQPELGRPRGDHEIA